MPQVTIALDGAHGSTRVPARAKPRRRATSGFDSFTPSELQVATMLGEGMAPREVAESLFVTIKAVDWPVRNAARKLGVPGRPELAEAMAQR